MLHVGYYVNVLCFHGQAGCASHLFHTCTGNAGVPIEEATSTTDAAVAVTLVILQSSSLEYLPSRMCTHVLIFNSSSVFF